tara:strand:+ start:129 stop:596 length:468 start_codon:yes stop_codon:yes gene_type:complete
MIISCKKCSKKFEIDSSLIPENGRLLKCGSCNYEWFFKEDKVKITKNIVKEPIINKKKQKKVDQKKTDLRDTDIDTSVNYTKAPTLNEEDLNKKDTNNISFLSMILIFIISMIALIILVDTFKNPISLIIPNIEDILFSLYETLKDIILFLKDLF